MLSCLRGAVADVLLGPGDHPGKITAGDQPAHSHGRRERLGRGSEMDDDIRLQAEQRRQRRYVVAEFAVVVVLDDKRARCPGPGDQRLPARDGQAPAERVLVGGRGVDHAQVIRQLAGHQAMLVGPAGHDPRAVRGEDRPGRRVAGLLDSDPVPGPQQRGGQQAQAAGHPPGHQDLAWITGHGTAPPQVRGQGDAEFRQAPRVGPGRRRDGARLPPGPAPGRGVDAAGPRDARPQLDERRNWTRAEIVLPRSGQVRAGPD